MKTNNINEKAQKITDLFFDAGARVSKTHYNFVVEKLNKAKEQGVRDERESMKEDVMIVYDQWRDEWEDRRFEKVNTGMFALGYRLRCCFEKEKSELKTLNTTNHE